jgi:hypothetical protein
MTDSACWTRLALIGAALAGGLMAGGLPGGARAADPAQIQRAIERGRDYLLRSQKTGPAGNLACYSLIKAGVDKQHPDIQKAVQEVLALCQTTGYIPPVHHCYQAGVDAMLLEAVDREAYRPQLELIAQYLIARQRRYGGWNYPSENADKELGDTSISQYAILGLWAAVRAGVEVPTENWERAAKWLLMTQKPDGGYTYHPVDFNGQIQGGDSSGTMTAAGTGSLLVIRHVLFSDVAFDDGVRPAAATKRFGVLERPPEEKQQLVKPKVVTKPTMSPAAFDTALKAGVRWTGNRFADAGALSGYGNYYYYGIERMAALLDVEKIGTHDWYNEGADDLLRKQTGDGSWNDSCGPMAATALTLLFLTKATAGTINKPKRTPLVGGGLLVGGRGLPANLDAIKINEGAVNTRKMHGPVDGLLAELEKSSGAKVEAAQEAIVEAVQLEHPEELIGQVDRLKRLAADKRIEVRRTAMWALGRTGNISVAPVLIRGLSDADEAVTREASAALCILSRRPNGCGLPADPLDGLAEEATNEQRSAHLDKWRKASTKLWTDWYLKIRPYDERDDRAALKRKP